MRDKTEYSARAAKIEWKFLPAKKIKYSLCDETFYSTVIYVKKDPSEHFPEVIERPQFRKNFLWLPNGYYVYNFLFQYCILFDGSYV